MLMSAAWRDLSPKQHELYLYCKAQLFAEKQKPYGDESFTMNRSKWNLLYGLYNDGNEKGFYRDIDALIEHGFIICKSSGKATRTKSIYAYSDKWRKWGTSDFNVSPNEMNSSQLARYRKQQSNDDDDDET
jgi:hypothetical protein